MRIGPIACLCAISFSACAADLSPQQRVSRPALPTVKELENHVRQNWSVWGKRFARFSGRESQAADLVGVSDVSCNYTYDTPECWLTVTGSFASGEVVQQKMFSQFERSEAGGLSEVIVMWHERCR